MPFLIRNAQIGLKINSNEGVAETLDPADFSATLSDVTETPAYPEDERGQLKGTLSPTPKLVGAPLCELGWTEELAGGSVSSASRWERVLRVAGFAPAVTLKAVLVGTLTGTELRPGDLLGNADTLGAATKTVRAVRLFAIGGNTYLVYEPLTGSALVDTEVLYAYDGSGEDVGSRPVDSSPADAGRGYRLLSEDGTTSSPDATLVFAADGKRHTFPSVRCNASVRLEHGQTGKIQITARGPKAPEADGSIAEAGKVTGVPAAVVPIMVGKLGYTVTIGTYKPVITGVTLEINNTLTDRPTINDDGIIGYGGQRMGFKPTRISDRRPMLRMAPEDVAKSVFDFIGVYDRGDLFPVHMTHGKPTDASGAVVINAPRAQIAGGVPRADRDGVTIKDLEILLTGEDDDELYVYAVHFNPA